MNATRLTTLSVSATRGLLEQAARSAPSNTRAPTVSHPRVCGDVTRGRGRPEPAMLSTQSRLAKPGVVIARVQAVSERPSAPQSDS